MSGGVVHLGVSFALAGVLDILHYGPPVIFFSIVLAYLAVFAGFCYAAWPFAASVVLVPYIAVKL
ncbi:hypothetical protein PF010_g31399, partial [Phytophthora fragariae]